MIIAILAIGAIILVTEFAMWRLFLRKMAGIDFPHEFDRSYFRFFTMLRMRIVVILHTLVLSVFCTLILLWQW